MSRFCYFHGTAGDAGGDLVGERMELENDGQGHVLKWTRLRVQERVLQIGFGLRNGPVSI